MPAQAFVHMGVILPLHGQINQQINHVIVGVRPAFLWDVSLQSSQVLRSIGEALHDVGFMRPMGSSS